MILLVYDRIRALREDHDMTQKQMAKILNISQRAYSHYETGERSIPVEILSEIADFYKTSVDYLINRTNNIKSYPKISD